MSANHSSKHCAMDYACTDCECSCHHEDFLDEIERERPEVRQIREAKMSSQPPDGWLPFERPEKRTAAYLSGVDEVFDISVISADQMIDPSARIVSIDGKPVEAKSGADHEGAMIAFYLSSADAKKLAVDDGEPADELHITLCYFDDKAADKSDVHWDKVGRVVAEVAREWAPLEGSLGGWGRFAVDEGDEPFVLSVDVLGLGALQQRLDDALEAADAPLNKTHGFNPHVTLAYLPKDGDDPDVADQLPLDIRIDAITLTVGGERKQFELSGESRVARAFPATARHPRDRTRDTNMATPLVDVDPSRRSLGAYIRQALGYPVKNIKGRTLAEHQAETRKKQHDFHADWKRKGGDSQNGSTPVRRQAEVNPQPGAPSPAQMALDALNANGGFSLTQSGAQHDQPSYVASYSGMGSTVPAPLITTDHIDAKIAQARDLGDAEVLIGGWFNQADELVYLDLSRPFTNLTDCTDFAQQNQQLAVWDGYNQRELVWSDVHQAYVPGHGAQHRPTGSTVTFKGDFFRNTLQNIMSIPDLFGPPEPAVEAPDVSPAGAQVIPFPTPPAAQKAPEDVEWRAAKVYDWEQDGV